MSISTSLRRAAKIQEKIEAMRELLAGLLDQARAELAAIPAETIPETARRSSGPRMQKRPAVLRKVSKAQKASATRGGKIDGRTKAARDLKAKPSSPLAGRKRASSPSGPLAPAVVKILAQKNKPMNVRDILDQLLASGYAFTASEPKKNLAARIYRLRGVKQVSAGLFATA